MTRVTVIEPPDGQHPHVLARRADQDLRAVFVIGRPESRGTTSVALDLLGAVGVRNDVVGKGKSSADYASLAVVWLAANRTRTVVVASPQPLTDDALDRLASLTTAAGTDLLLACDRGHAAATACRLAAWDAVEAGWTETIAALPPAQAHEPHTENPDPVEWDRQPRLPRSDFTTFRDDCRRLLAPDDFEHVDRLYARTARTVHSTPDEPTQEGVFDGLARALDGCATLDDSLTVLRATQAGLFKRGWFLGADIEKVVTRLTSEHRAVPLTDSQWRSLRAYLSPSRAACCALNALGHSNAEIMALTLAEADDHAPLLRAAHPLALPYLRAQRLHRYANGALPTDPYVTAKGAAICTAFRDARADLGLRLANNVATGHAARSRRFRAALGLRLIDVRPRTNGTAR
ncbi:MAG: hypothetical protein JWO60_112 [Frankiales bacterium]|jgi:hypothetical protein|nr:hypothetical protein [Frankiales bacterium]